MTEQRDINELLDTTDPAWPLVQKWAKEATNPVEILPASSPQRREALVATQVTTHSTMGAIIYETGGLLVDYGWLRVLGSGHPRLPRSLPAWNLSRSFTKPGTRPGFLLVADDVVGGFFAINGGAFGTNLGKVYYFAPDSLVWENTGKGYTDFVRWSFFGRLDTFYQDYRWPEWEADVSALSGDRAYSIWPPPCTAGEPYSKRGRRDVPVAELYDFYVARYKDS